MTPNPHKGATFEPSPPEPLTIALMSCQILGQKDIRRLEVIFVIEL